MPADLTTLDPKWEAFCRWANLLREETKNFYLDEYAEDGPPEHRRVHIYKARGRSVFVCRKLGYQAEDAGDKKMALCWHQRERAFASLQEEIQLDGFVEDPRRWTSSRFTETNAQLFFEEAVRAGQNLVGKSRAVKTVRVGLGQGGRPPAQNLLDVAEILRARGETHKTVFARLCGISVDTLERVEGGFGCSDKNATKIRTYLKTLRRNRPHKPQKP
jgi:hypothetical protein